MRRHHSSHSTKAGLRPAARGALLGLLTAVLLLAMGAAPAAAPAQGTLTTLFTSMTTPSPTVTGMNSVPIGPSDIGTFRAAMAFTPTVSGKAQVLSMRGQCVIPGVNGTACAADSGRVSIQSDAGGKPSGVELGSMGFYLLENAEGAWMVQTRGNPTGGSFRLNNSGDVTTGPIPYNASHFAMHLAMIDVGWLPEFLSDGGLPDPAFFRSGNATVTAVDIHLTGGTNPSVSAIKPHLQEECGTLSPAPQLTAGTKYWAVMTAESEVGWNDWTDDTAEVLESIDDGPWQAAFNPKTLALRIDSGFDACVPVAVPNPDPGTTIGDMTTRTGEQAFNTITIENTGVAPLTLSRVSFTGPDADVFSLKDTEPGPLARPYRLPRSQGVGSVSILYPTCTGAAVERLYTASMTLEMSDPSLPTITYPLECRVDNTGPTVSFFRAEPNGLNGWWTTSPFTLGVVGNDQSDSGAGGFVKHLVCSDSNPDASWSPRQVFGGAMTSSITGEGLHTASCNATDVAGNVGLDSTTDFKIDSRPPVVSSTTSPPENADGWRRSTTTITFGCDEPVPGSGLDEPATGGGSVDTETAGTKFTSGGCTDLAGNKAVPLETTVRIDMTAPVVRPAGVSPEPNAAGWNHSDATVSFECADAGEVQSGIKTPAPDVVVSQETAATTVTSTGCVDRAENAATEGPSQTVKLDKTEPSTHVDAEPPVLTNARDASFEFGGEDGLSGVAGFECRLDAGSFEACAADGKTYSDLSEGEHAFRVRAVDVAGNVDGTPESRSWTIDSVAPETSIDSGPDPVTSATLAAFTFSGDALGGSAVSGYECRLDDDAFAACPGSGVEYSGLGDGEHSFEVRASDAAGNVDGSPAIRTWTVDTLAPDTSVESGPDAVTSDTSAGFAYSGDALGGSAVSSYECSLDEAAFAACAADGVEYAGLAGGEHGFRVRALDAAGNVDGSPASWSWTVDLDAPTTTITDGPEADTLATSASFSFGAVDEGGSTVAGFECRLDEAAFAPCVSPAEVTGLAAGEHRFEVRAADLVGNVESPAVGYEWTIEPFYSVDDSASTLEDAAVSIDVRGNDVAPDGAAVTVTPTGPRSSQGGSVDSDGDQLLRYVPPADFNGTDTFQYVTATRGVTSAPATVTVTVRAVDDRPTFSPGGEVTVDEDSGPYAAPWASSISAGPSEVQQLRFIIGESSNPALFSAGPSISPAGVLSFNPAPNANGTATVELRLVDDGDQASAPVSLAITVRSVNDAPTIAVARAFECGGASGMLNVLVGDVDDDSSRLAISPSAIAGVAAASAGAGSNRSVRLTGLHRRMRATLTVAVSDGSKSATTAIALVVGTNRRETITGSDGPDLVFGRGGNDALRGLGGNDLMCGGHGSDFIDGGAGTDVLLGGVGDDVLRGGVGDDVLRGGWGADRLYGEPGDDILRGGRGADRFNASPGNDQLLDFNSREGDRR